MRADRLIAVLLLLQRHGSVTTSQVAAELDVSVSTARRDLASLSRAGIPVYATPGRGGGWQMLGNHRTDLTGLTEPEVRALFLALGAAPGKSPQVQTALRKLQHAVPVPFQDQAHAAASAMFVDLHPRTGNVGVLEPAFLPQCQEAVIRGTKTTLGYTDAQGKRSTRTIDPLGVVLRTGIWYFIADTVKGRRMFRVDRVTECTLLAEPAAKPDSFDLAETWQQMSTQPWDNQDIHAATIVAKDWVVRALPYVVGVSVHSTSAPDDDGWFTVEVSAASYGELAAKLTGFAESVHVLEPLDVRDRMAQIGSHLVETYGPHRRPV